MTIRDIFRVYINKFKRIYDHQDASNRIEAETQHELVENKNSQKTVVEQISTAKPTLSIRTTKLKSRRELLNEINSLKFKIDELKQTVNGLTATISRLNSEKVALQNKLQTQFPTTEHAQGIAVSSNYEQTNEKRAVVCVHAQRQQDDFREQHQQEFAATMQFINDIEESWRTNEKTNNTDIAAAVIEQDECDLQIVRPKHFSNKELDEVAQRIARNIAQEEAYKKYKESLKNQGGGFYFNDWEDVDPVDRDINDLSPYTYDDIRDDR